MQKLKIACFIFNLPFYIYIQVLGFLILEFQTEGLNEGLCTHQSHHLNLDYKNMSSADLISYKSVSNKGKPIGHVVLSKPFVSH